MAIDLRLRRLAAVLALAAATFMPAASTAADSQRWFAIVDLRFPQRPAVLYSLPNTPAAPVRDLSFVLLTPEPDPPRTRCCVRPQPKPAAMAAESEALWLRPDDEAAPLRAQSAKRPRLSRQGGIGLAFGKLGAKVDAVDARTLRLRWPQQQAALRVMRCVSREGMHIRVTPDDTRPAETQHLYVPLGMEVEPTCPADIMAPVSAPKR